VADGRRGREPTAAGAARVVSRIVSKIPDRSASASREVSTPRTRRPFATIQILSADLLEGGIAELTTPAGRTLVEENLTPEAELLLLDDLSGRFRRGQENEAEAAAE
jgi:hypothetical protein